MGDIAQREELPAGTSSRSSLDIAFLVAEFPSVSETFVAFQIQGLIERGHRVSVISERHPLPEQPANVHDWVHTCRQVRYLAPPPGLIGTAYARLPYRLRQRWVEQAERAALAEHDVLICNFGWFGARAATHITPATRARLITIFHGADMSSTLADRGPHYYDELFARGDLFLSINAFWIPRLAALGAPEARMAVHRMGVDLSQFSFRPPPQRGRAPFRLVTVCRLVEKKGTEYLLHALSLLGRDRSDLDVTLDVIGDGPLRGRLETLAVDLGLGDRVRFHGALPHEAVTNHLAAADAFVLPSVVAADGDMEGIPVALMEAMASGLPVISTRHSGIPELIEHGVTGYLADERDAEGLARVLETLVVSPEQRLAIARAARAKVERDFNLARLNDDFEAIVRSVMEMPRRA